ncbi:PKD domain-containing protein [Nitrospira sp. M1]
MFIPCTYHHSASWILKFLVLPMGMTLFIGGNGLAFTILEPTNDSTFTPGQEITVRLDPQDLSNLIQAKFYWYWEHEDMLLESIDENLARTSTQSDNPPFGGTIKIPETAIGQLRLLAVGDRAGGQFHDEKWAIFDEVFLTIEPEAELIEIDFQTNKPLAFGRAAGATVYDKVDFLGTIAELPVIGIFADGITRPIRRQSSGTTYHSSNEKVVLINPDGLMQLVGNGKTTITVKNRGKEASLAVVVEVQDEPNESPVADPGKNKSVQSGARVQLNALRSFDPEGGSLQYYWSQIGGSNVPLLDPYSAKASFLAPYVESTRIFRFKLRVTDIQGADSFPAFVDIAVEP